ncbi:hypothetical protein, partial [Streptomyces sp. NPDC127574]|uniref:hypothetical protein n=1 Tax=Streptomyces sp. NPDC127574 TaxID=3345401 RepID=UPI003626703A
MQSRAFLGSALVPVLALAITAPGMAAAPAASATASATAVGVGPWTAPKQLTGVTDVLDLESNRNGTLAGLFRQGSKTVLSVRPDNVYDYHLRDLRLAVAKDGAVGLIWGGDSYYTGDGVDPDPTAYQWHYRYLEKAAGSPSWSAPRKLTQLGDKPRLVTLSAHPQGGFQLVSGGDYSRKPAGSADWGPVESTGIYANHSQPAELLTSANGDVTAVGSGTGGPAVATRVAARGSWTGTQDLARSTENDSVRSTRTADGSVVVTYTQKRYVSSRTVRRDFVAQTVGVGSTSKPRTLNSLTDGTSS